MKMWGKLLSQLEGSFPGGGEASMRLSELLDLAANAAIAEPPRQAAIACYLSRSEGWRDAAELLGGAFANAPTDEQDDDVSRRTGLSEGKKE